MSAKALNRVAAAILGVALGVCAISASAGPLVYVLTGAQ